MTKEQFEKKLNSMPDIKEVTNKGFFVGYGGGSYVFKVRYKGVVLDIDFFPKEDNNHIIEVSDYVGEPDSLRKRNQLKDILTLKNVEDVRRITKNIKKKATKLPNKKLKLENNIESFMNEICK